MTTTGPNSGSASSQTSSGKPAWSNLGNLYASDNSYATAQPLGTSFVTEDARVTGFGFSVSGTVVGITVEIERNTTNSSGTQCKDSRVFLTKDGSSTVGNNKASASTWPTSDAYATYGSSSDLWGTTWSAADINSSNFGVILAIVGDTGFGTPTGSVDHIRITVETTVSTFVARRALMGVGI